VPTCWPRHPHLVHEIAVLADRRRRAIHAYTSDALEEWHRYDLPTFVERMHRRIGGHCNTGHPQGSPATGRYKRHAADTSAAARSLAFAADLSSMTADASQLSGGPRPRLIDKTTGEVVGSQSIR